MIKNIILEFDRDEALALRDLIDGFFYYQNQCGIGEGSRRVTLANKLLQELPNHRKMPAYLVSNEEGSYYTMYTEAPAFGGNVTVEKIEENIIKD